MAAYMVWFVVEFAKYNLEYFFVPTKRSKWAVLSLSVCWHKQNHICIYHNIILIACCVI